MFADRTGQKKSYAFESSQRKAEKWVPAPLGRQQFTSMTSLSYERVACSCAECEFCGSKRRFVVELASTAAFAMDAVVTSLWNIDPQGIVTAAYDGVNITLASSSTMAPPLGRNEPLARIEVAVLATILGLALLGNGLVAGVLRRLQSRQKLTRMNTMIAHLIVADTAVALFNVLPQVSDEG